MRSTPETAAAARSYLEQLHRNDRDRRFVARMEDVVIAGATHSDADSWRWMEEQLRTSFLEYGIDLLALSPEEIAERIVTRYGTKVVAVDGSPAMLEIATTRRADPRIDYRLVQDARLPFLADDAIDTAMSCYVFINIASLDVISTIAREVYRVLRPGRRYAILDTNPDTTGVEFTTFRSGDPGRRYARGEQRRVLLRQPDGGEMTLLDYHWPKEVYHQVLTDAGFGSIDMHEPIFTHPPGADDPSRGRRWMNEKVQPPFLIVVGEK